MHKNLTNSHILANKNQLFLGNKDGKVLCFIMGIFFADHGDDLKVLLDDRGDLATQISDPLPVGYHWVKCTQIETLSEGDGARLCQELGKFWPMMPSWDQALKLESLPSLFAKKGLSNAKEIIFFGGSFNPWHKGHMECLNLCHKAFPEKEIMVLPDSSPWKQGEDDRGVWETYRELCLLLKDTPFSVYSGFWGMGRSNPSIDWIFKTDVSEKWILLGDDTFFGILKWKDATRLLEGLDCIVVVPRQRSTKEIVSFKEEILRINPKLRIEIMAEHQYGHLSSTNLRTN